MRSQSKGLREPGALDGTEPEESKVKGGQQYPPYGSIQQSGANRFGGTRSNMQQPQKNTRNNFFASPVKKETNYGEAVNRQAHPRLTIHEDQLKQWIDQGGKKPEAPAPVPKPAAAGRVLVIKSNVASGREPSINSRMGVPAHNRSKTDDLKLPRIESEQ